MLSKLLFIGSFIDWCILSWYYIFRPTDLSSLIFYGVAAIYLFMMAKAFNEMGKNEP
jgi:hypothetical protein